MNEPYEGGKLRAWHDPIVLRELAATCISLRNDVQQNRVDMSNQVHTLAAHLSDCMLYTVCCWDRSVETRRCPIRTCIRHSSGRSLPRTKSPSQWSLYWNISPGHVSPSLSATGELWNINKLYSLFFVFTDLFSGPTWVIGLLWMSVYMCSDDLN